ncbi:hypothetical protein Ccrd_025463 [Cynara cardunculus var. scolymus]|uniref:Uncharacterized protein n=1 Tax=Cynara cardunculus var. scolymus TaxID=59895 RepID=A0A103X4B0_CYNCS|nr:hypothetical protein Ccrd_025463 [Cynara cardunculus var. scolymus]
MYGCSRAPIIKAGIKQDVIKLGEVLKIKDKDSCLRIGNTIESRAPIIKARIKQDIINLDEVLKIKG